MPAGTREQPKICYFPGLPLTVMSSNKQRPLLGGRCLLEDIRNICDLAYKCPPFLVDVLWHGVKSRGRLFSDLVNSLLQFAANHHFHHHIEFGVKHDAHPRIAFGNLFQLHP